MADIWENSVFLPFLHDFTTTYNDKRYNSVNNHLYQSGLYNYRKNTENMAIGGPKSFKMAAFGGKNEVFSRFRKIFPK